MPKQEKGFYEAYAGFARTLRTWLIAYGVGAPVVFLSNEAIWSSVVNANKVRLVAWAFLIGVSIQVFTAILYKTAMWYLYMGEDNDAFRKTTRYKVSDWLSECYVLESILDLASIVLFAYATFVTVNALAI